MTKISFWSRLLDLVAPRQCCLCCRRLSPTEQVLCASCNVHLPRTQFHLAPTDNVMARLFWGLMPVERAAALFYYEAHSRASAIVYDMKYHDQPDIGLAMGQLMGREFGESGFFDGVDVIVPMPLARVRERQRGYNQSLSLARGVSRATGLPVAAGAVARTRFRQSQTRMERWDRQANVEGVFRVADASAVSGRHVLLVDDVVTTGATMTACGRELLRAGAARLSLLALGVART